LAATLQCIGLYRCNVIFISYSSSSNNRNIFQSQLCADLSESLADRELLLRMHETATRPSRHSCWAAFTSTARHAVRSCNSRTKSCCMFFYETSKWSCVLRPENNCMLCHDISRWLQAVHAKFIFDLRVFMAYLHE